MMKRFAGQVAIVTGGASGIGEAVCLRLAGEGASVVVADINGEPARKLAEQLGGGSIAVEFDAGDTVSARRLVEAAMDLHGRIDVLHNNAAISSPDVHARDTDAVRIDFETWDRVMAVNLRGYLAACKFALPHMIAVGRGAIVNTASAGGFSGDVSRIAYNVSKAAILGLTRQIATQHGAQGIRCNAVAPGLVLTPAVRAVAADVVEVMGRHILTKQFGEPADIASLVCFLASDEARYINGQVYVIDGGMLAHNPAHADLLDYMTRHTTDA
jgi:NAD(P)-dependent dehydrogenase (short-subunit alcohol dehydrogenase family)